MIILFQRLVLGNVFLLIDNGELLLMIKSNYKAEKRKKKKKDGNKQRNRTSFLVFFSFSYFDFLFRTPRLEEWMAADCIFSSPLTRAAQTAFITTDEHPHLKNKKNPIVLWSSAREIKVKQKENEKKKERKKNKQGKRNSIIRSEKE